MSTFLPALLTCFNGVTLELIQLASCGWTTLRRVCNGTKLVTPSSVNFSTRNWARSPFGRRGGHFQPDRQLTPGRFHGMDVKSYASPGHGGNLGRVLPAVAVEEANLVTGAKAADRGKMVSLGTGQFDWAYRQRTVDIKPFGHPCYNSRTAWKAQGRLVRK